MNQVPNRGHLRSIPTVEVSKRDLVELRSRKLIDRYNQTPNGQSLQFTGEEIGWVFALNHMYRRALSDIITGAARFGDGTTFANVTRDMAEKVLAYDPDDYRGTGVGMALVDDPPTIPPPPSVSPDEDGGL